MKRLIEEIMNIDFTNFQDPKFMHQEEFKQK
jgi:hypothetical protein